MEKKLVKSAARVIQVLELFDEARRPLAVAEVAALAEIGAVKAVMSGVRSVATEVSLVVIFRVSTPATVKVA